MKLCIIGATGNCGVRLVRAPLERGCHVTAVVRDKAKLEGSLGAGPTANLTAVELSLEDKDALVAAMQGCDAVINAAGNANDGPAYAPLVQRVINAADAALGAGGRFWFFGGAAALDVPGTSLMTVDLPKVPRIFEAHRANLEHVRTTRLDWSMLCPGPMIPAPDGRPTTGLRLSEECWPVERPPFTYVLPRIALSLAFKQSMPEMTVYYEDAAAVILDHLAPNGRFSRKRVGVALPSGMRRHKDYAPAS
jgi:hypothetical protein